jgi:hypothetical protein
MEEFSENKKTKNERNERETNQEKKSRGHALRFSQEITSDVSDRFYFKYNDKLQATKWAHKQGPLFIDFLFQLTCKFC